MLLRRSDANQSRQQLKEQLDLVKTTAASKLQVNVFENYSQFIQTSKEVTTLEVDMLELRNFLTEVNSTIKGLQTQSLNFDSKRENNYTFMNHFGGKEKIMDPCQAVTFTHYLSD
jgi:hypothetical protein